MGSVSSLVKVSILMGTVSSYLNEYIKKICDGLDITLIEFFSSPEFESLEQEIK